jgi:DMSO/TMAO reductase YedYZ molybdopterin-dependent catalytic subunit
MGLFDDLLNRRKEEQEAKSSKRLPPGQSLTKKFPVLTYGPNPRFDLKTWDLRFFGEIEAKPDVTHEGQVGTVEAEAYQVWNELYWERDSNKVISASSSDFQAALQSQAGTTSFDNRDAALDAVAALIQSPPETKTVTNESPLTWTYEQMLSLPTVEVMVDIHCVTRWSKFDTTWKGVRFRDFAETYLNVSPDVNFVIAHCDYGYTTNLPIDVMMDDDVLITYLYAGVPLEPDHGAPVRTLVPKRYFWKSAKFLRAIEFSKDDKPGFWERAGYHNDGDPFKEERYGGRRGFF